MQGQSIRILLVEDSLPDALLVTRRLEMELGSLRQIEFERTSSLEEAIHHLRNKPADVVLLDLNLPDSAGTETVRRLRAAEPKVPILVYASAGEVGLPLRALQAGAQDFLSKGDFEYGSLIDRIRSVIERTRIFGEMQRFQSDLEDAERIQSLGVLGVGAALGFNQLIGAVLDHTSAAMSELSDSPHLSRAMLHLLETRKAALHAIELAAHLRDYARPDRAEPQQLHMSEFVRAERPQLEMIAGSGIELECALAKSDPAISVNPLELRQVLFNLVINASEAIRPSTGRISIDTGDIWADAELLATGRGAPDLREGHYAMLCVRDSGRALDRESLSRLFDPLLTTHVGRALGLAPALGAVRRHGGWIGAGLEPSDRGTRFQVLFPIAA
ncbi:MAG: response regulator [Deltaproteobacteria bacterium]|nr:MAG: response regulator [Deltaproteobacteria bacterium]